MDSKISVVQANTPKMLVMYDDTGAVNPLVSLYSLVFR